MRLPVPRGPVTAELDRVLRGPDGSAAALLDRAAEAVRACPSPDAVLVHEDIQLALYVLYEQHYSGLSGIDADWEWSPELLAVRAVLERAFEDAIRACVPVPAIPARRVDVTALLTTVTAEDDGPSLSRFLCRSASVGQFREFLQHRSLYELKEADPHSWAIPRLTGQAKAALVEIQVDEYGGGDADRMHSALFARAMRALGLDDRPGAHLDVVPAATVATVNAMSLFGLHRRLRGAAVGHLAAFEMTSTEPNRRYADGLRRLGFGPDATCFFDEHVEADAVHEQLATHDLCGGLVTEEPGLLPDVLLGAATAQELERRAGGAVLATWEAGRSSLRPPGRAGLGSVA